MSLVAGKIVRPRRRILVKMLPVKGDYHNPLGLEILDQKKHWNHQFRRGRVVAFDPVIMWHVPDLMLGDVVVFNGSAGFTLDGDVMDDDDKYEDPLKGENFRWLHWKEIDAIDEGETEKRLQERLSV